MAATLTSIRLDTPSGGRSRQAFLGVKSRTAAVHVALREIVVLGASRLSTKKHAGKLSFAGHGE